MGARTPTRCGLEWDP